MLLWVLIVALFGAAVRAESFSWNELRFGSPVRLSLRARCAMRRSWARRDRRSRTAKTRPAQVGATQLGGAQVGVVELGALQLHPLHIQAVEDRALGRQGGQVQTRDRLQGPQIDAVEDRGLPFDPAGLAPAGVFTQHFGGGHPIDGFADRASVRQRAFHVGAVGA